MNFEQGKQTGRQREAVTGTGQIIHCDFFFLSVSIVYSKQLSTQKTKQSANISTDDKSIFNCMHFVSQPAKYTQSNLL